MWLVNGDINVRNSYKISEPLLKGSWACLFAMGHCDITQVAEALLLMLTSLSLSAPDCNITRIYMIT